jgi:hypothetical protein
MAIHAGNDDHQADRAQCQAAANAAEPHVEHAVEIAGNPRFREHVTHEDKERHCDKRIPVQHRKGGIIRHLERAFAPKQERGERADKTDHAEYALPSHEQHHHGCKHEERYEFRTHM